MIYIKGVSVHAFLVATRFARRYDFPQYVADFTQDDSDKLQAVAKEVDRRYKLRRTL